MAKRDSHIIRVKRVMYVTADVDRSVPRSVAAS